MDYQEFLKLLKGELEGRIAKNARYSLRSFARALEIDPSLLSRILRGKQRASVPTMRQALAKLGRDPEELTEEVTAVRSVALLAPSTRATAEMVTVRFREDQRREFAEFLAIMRASFPNVEFDVQSGK